MPDSEHSLERLVAPRSIGASNNPAGINYPLVGNRINMGYEEFAMLKTTWKPEEEIRQSLAGSRSLGIVACGFCAYLSGTGGPCALDPDRTCPWQVILERGDPVGLQNLARIQEEDGTPAFPPDPDPRPPDWARRVAAWAMAHSGPFSRFVHLIR